VALDDVGIGFVDCCGVYVVEHLEGFGLWVLDVVYVEVVGI